MHCSPRECKILRNGLRRWVEAGELENEIATKLNDNLTASFDWLLLAKYAIWIAAVSIVIGIVAFFCDSRIIQYILSRPPMLRAITAALFATAFFYYGFRLQNKNSPFACIPLFLACCTTIAVWINLGIACKFSNNEIADLSLLGLIVYCTIGWIRKLPLVWAFGLCTLAVYLDMRTGYLSDQGMYWLGMEEPLKFLILGLLLFISSLALRQILSNHFLYNTTLVFSLLFTNIALWILSIFGLNSASQIQLFFWSLLFFISSCSQIIIGMRLQNNIIKRFGIVFICLLLYTKFFEYFWDQMHKAVFFIILGISFILLAKAVRWYGNKNVPDKQST